MTHRWCNGCARPARWWSARLYTVEYAFGGWGTNVSVGTPLNPWDLTAPRAPGGSSNGSGVAVGAGLVPAALGTDTGGSVRLPAAFCGAVGLKTTAGLLSIDGVLPLSKQFDTVGPLTRTVADAARLLTALVAEDVSRLTGGAALVAEPAAVLSRGVAGRRIGVLALPDVPLHPDTARVFAQTQALLQSLGATLVPASLPRPVTSYLAAMGKVASVHGYLEYETLADAEPNLLGAPVRRRMLGGREVSAAWMLAELEQRAQDIAAMAEMFADLHALLLPTTAFPAPKLSEYDEDASPATLTRFVNYLELAAITLPMGLSAEQLPIGMQIVVPGFREVRALSIAAALEDARGGPLSLDMSMQ